MDKQPFISIVVVCYNYAHLLPRTLNAIAEQTFRDFEVVFVDNGCTDNSVEIVERFMQEHPDIPVNIVTVMENQGLAHGDNVGADSAIGKYLLFNDADDWMDNNTLELLANVALETDADRVIGSYRNVDQNGNILREQWIAENPHPYLYTMQQANLFKTEIYRNHNIHIKDSLWVDAEKTLRFSRYAEKLGYVKDPCYNYFVHTDSTSKHKEIYKRIWQKEYSLKTLLTNVLDEYRGVDVEKKLWIEYALIYIYYSYMFQFLRDAPLKEKIQNQAKLRIVMKELLPDYLKNPKLSLNWKGGKPMRGRLLVRIFTLLERFGLMGLGMCMYHLMSKIVYLHAN